MGCTYSIFLQIGGDSVCGEFVLQRARRNSVCEASGVEPSGGSWERTVGRRRLVWKSKEVPLTSDVLDPEREREERDPEPEPETVPEEEPGITAPEPDTLPEEPDITPPASAGQRI